MAHGRRDGRLRKGIVRKRSLEGLAMGDGSGSPLAGYQTSQCSSARGWEDIPRHAGGSLVVWATPQETRWLPNFGARVTHPAVVVLTPPVARRTGAWQDVKARYPDPDGLCEGQKFRGFPVQEGPLPRQS